MDKNKRQKQQSSVFEYFSITLDDRFFICQVTKDSDDKICGRSISAYSGENSSAPTRASNLKRHLQRCHPSIFETVTEKDKQASEVKPGPTSSSQCQLTVTKFFKSQNITVAMTEEKFKRCIIEMVYSNALPLTFFSSPAFVSLNGEMASKFGCSLERNNIRKLVLQEAKNQKEILKDILNGRFVFLKMDACTRHRVNYFAINVQFIDDNKKVATRTLAVKDTEAQHTSKFLQELVMNVLTDFGINKQQILCIVTDNATNMISTVNKLNEYVEACDFDENCASVEEIFDIDGFVDSALNFSQIHHMRCAVHTLQLAIRDGLEDYYANRLITKIRSVVVACRTPKLDAILKRRAGKGAILDQATRWGSTYLMIERIIALKPFLTDMANPAVTMTDVQWEQVEKLESLLRHPYTATKSFQAAGLTASMFYKEWCNLIFRFSKANCKIADAIKDSMLRREITLLDNDILLAGIYVDPMVRVLLTEERKIRAKSALYELAVRIKGIQLQDKKHDDNSPSNINTESFKDDFEKFLDEQEQTKRCRLNSLESSVEKETLTILAKFKIDFYQALNEVEKFDRSSNVTIKNAISRYPEIIQDAALITTALPPTQVSVERLFSALRIIKSDLRASMKPDIIEAILFLNTNSE